MKVTLSVIKADVGGYVGHTDVHPDMMKKAEEAKKAEDEAKAAEEIAKAEAKLAENVNSDENAEEVETSEI